VGFEVWGIKKLGYDYERWALGNVFGFTELKRNNGKIENNCSLYL